jgi:hypothetical protein
VVVVVLGTAGAGGDGTRLGAVVVACGAVVVGPGSVGGGCSVVLVLGGGGVVVVLSIGGSWAPACQTAAAPSAPVVPRTTTAARQRDVTLFAFSPPWP